MTRRAPDDFHYMVTQSPLHFPPYDLDHPNAGLEPETDQARLRRHTSDLKAHIATHPDAKVTDLLESGEQLGERVVCFYAHSRERRARHDRLDVVKSSGLAAPVSQLGTAAVSVSKAKIKLKIATVPPPTTKEAPTGTKPPLAAQRSLKT